MNLADHVRYVPDFPKTGVRFCDMTPLFADRFAFMWCIQDMIDSWWGEEVARIGVFDARGFLFGSVMAY